MPGIPGSKSGHVVSVKVQVADNFLFADHTVSVKTTHPLTITTRKQPQINVDMWVLRSNISSA